MQRIFDITFLFHQRGQVKYKLNCTYSSSISRITIRAIGLSLLGPSDLRTIYQEINDTNVHHKNSAMLPFLESVRGVVHA
jgi:hypothetical protein